jgi:hypothetical protein
MSHFFPLPEAYTDGPMLLFLLFVSFLIYFASVEWVRRSQTTERKAPTVFLWIVGVSILIRFFYLPSQMIEETDAFRYLWNGQVSQAGINPYVYSPNQAAHQGIIDTSNESTVNNLLERVNYPYIRTVYPPGAQIFFWLASLMTSFNLLGWKALLFFRRTWGFYRPLFYFQRASNEKGMVSPLLKNFQIVFISICLQFFF